jgi:hypothetical protein
MTGHKPFFYVAAMFLACAIGYSPSHAACLVFTQLLVDRSWNFNSALPLY